MARTDTSAKIKGRSTRNVRNNLRGGIIQDFMVVPLVSGQTVTLNSDVYESRVRTNNSGEMVALLPNRFVTDRPLLLGQRHLVTYDLEGAAADSVAISGFPGASGSLIVHEALVISGVTSYTRAAFTRVSLLSGSDRALFEYAGLSGTADMWNLLYLNGTAIPS